MIANLKPYPAMKDSGVPWLGEVPEHWDVLRGRRVFEIRKRIAGELGHPVISVTQAGLRVKDIKTNDGQMSQDYSKYQTVKIGEFAMNSMDLLTGGVGLATSPGVTSPDYRVFAICNEARCFDRYMLHVLRMLYRNRGFYAWGQGSAQLGRWRLPRKRFNNFPFPVPPLEAQASIERFIEYVDRRIRRYIRAKQKLIKLLEEQKQAIIHQAVTGQIDVCTGNPYPAYKPSGVEWLGEVPEHWEAVPLRYLGTKFGSGITPRGGATVYQDTGVPLLRSQNVHFSGLRLEGVARISPELHESLSATHVHPGDVLLNITGASLGRVCTAPHDFSQGNVNQHVCIIRTKQAKLAPEFLSAFLSTPGMQREIQVEQTGAAREGLTLNAIRSFMILLPPLSEQSAIIENLNEATASIDSAITRANREIELLNEYRTRLIADVVTGKLDVREAAASLPDEAEDAESTDDLDEVIETEMDQADGQDGQEHHDQEHDDD